MVDYFTERYEAEARQILDLEILDTDNCKNSRNYKYQ